MATSLLVDVAASICSKLNAQSFEKTLEAVRIYDTEVKLQDLAGGRIVVRPSDEEPVAVIGRALDRREFRIDVAVQCKIEAATGEDTAEIDGWMAYVDEIKAYLNRLAATDAEPYFTVTAVDHKPAYSEKHLREMRLFFAVLVVKIRANWRPA